MQTSKLRKIIPVGTPATIVYFVGETDDLQIRMPAAEIKHFLSNGVQHYYTPEKIKAGNKIGEMGFVTPTHGDDVARLFSIDAAVFQVSSKLLCLTGNFQHYERFWSLITTGSSFIHHGCGTCK